MGPTLVVYTDLKLKHEHMFIQLLKRYNCCNALHDINKQSCFKTELSVCCRSFNSV